MVAKQKVIIIEFNEKQNSHKFHDRIKVAVVVDLFLLVDCVAALRSLRFRSSLDRA